MKLRALLLFIAAFSLLISCKKSNTTTPAENTGNNGQTISIGGDPTQNQFVYGSENEEILQVDAATGKQQQSIYKFPTYTNVAGLAYANDIIYSGAEDDGTHAINAQTKTLVWQTPLVTYRTATAVSIIPVINGNVCYSAGDNGVIVANDATSGNLIWPSIVDPNYSGPDGYYHVGQITVTNQYVITGSIDVSPIGGGPNYIFVLDKTTGKLLYRYALPAGKYLSGAIKVIGSTMIIPANNLYSVDITTGNILWTYPMGDLTRGAGTPVISGTTIFFQGADGVGLAGNLYSIDLNTGKLNWKIAAGIDPTGVYTPVISGDYVFGVYERGSSQSTTGNGRPFVVQISTGKLLWANDNLSVRSSPVLANGRLFFFGQNFKGTSSNVQNNVGLLSMDASSGNLLWLNNYFQYETTGPVVVATNGAFNGGVSQ